MEKNKGYEKRLGIRLREAYLKDYEGPAMSREEFHRLVETAEKKKKHRRTLIGVVAACVTLCLVCGGFMAGVSMRESASAGKDNETKTVQQGGSVVIGSGVSENDQNVGVSTKTYTNIEDIPEDLREQIHFLDSDEFELEKVRVMCLNTIDIINICYTWNGETCIYLEKELQPIEKEKIIATSNIGEKVKYKKIEVYEKSYDKYCVLTFFDEGYMTTISISNPVSEEIKEVILNDLNDITY